jgi:hypothetical protein
MQIQWHHINIIRFNIRIYISQISIIFTFTGKIYSYFMQKVYGK